MWNNPTNATVVDDDESSLSPPLLVEDKLTAGTNQISLTAGPLITWALSSPVVFLVSVLCFVIIRVHIYIHELSQQKRKIGYN